MTTDDILVDKLCHVFSVHSRNCTSFNPATQIVPCEHSKSKTIFLRTPRQINEINSYFLPYDRTPRGVQRLLLSYSRSSLTFSARFDVFDDVIVHVLPLIPPVQLIVSPLLPTMPSFVVQLPKNLKSLLRFANNSPRGNCAL